MYRFFWGSVYIILLYKYTEKGKFLLIYSFKMVYPSYY